MKASSIFKAILLLSGWGVAAWLFLSKPLEPIPLAPPKEQGTPMPPSSSDNRIESPFREWSADPALAGALVGFCVLDEAGKTVFASSLAETALCPASALKTVTTAAALEVLGPDFSFGTTLTSSAEIGSEGILNGDLRLLGGGDPTLSVSDLEAMADALVKRGLKLITGRLRVSEATFNERPVNDHWNWGDIGNAYGAGAYGVNLDHNRITIRFDPGAREGAQATLLDDATLAKDTRWINQVTTGPPGSGDRVVVYSEPYGGTITLQGTVPLGEKGFAVTGANPDPPDSAARILQARLKRAGVTFLDRDLPKGSTVVLLAGHLSARLPEIIDHLHKVSDNLEAQCLFLKIGHEQKTDPADAIRRHWESRGVAFNGLRLIDGSGLARANMIRPLDLAKVNHLARRGPHGDRFRQSLTAYLDGKVSSKLGAMSGVKTEVGFLTMPDGREYTFALMANGLGLDVNFWPLREKLLEAVRSN